MDWQLESLLVASESDVMRMSTDHVGGLVDDVILSTEMGGKVTAMLYDWATGKLYLGVTSESNDRSADYIAAVDLHQQQKRPVSVR